MNTNTPPTPQADLCGLPSDNLYCLLPGRHPIPGDPPALLAGWDFANRWPMPWPDGSYIVNLACGPSDAGNPYGTGFLNIVVTGLTPALLWALTNLPADCWNVMLWHYDRDSGTYWPQRAPFRAPTSYDHMYD